MRHRFVPSLWHSLRHPRAQLRAMEESRRSWESAPRAVWIQLVLIAVVGSCLYGASLSHAVPTLRPMEGALWIALSAGLAWCVFLPALVALTGRSAVPLAHACLVTMAYGEMVLLVGAILNIAWVAPAGQALGAALNLGVVAVSNVVMAAALAAQLQAVGVSIARTLAAWIIVLNGSGALFFWLFRRLLGGYF